MTHWYQQLLCYNMSPPLYAGTGALLYTMLIDFLVWKYKCFIHIFSEKVRKFMLYPSIVLIF